MNKFNEPAPGRYGRLVAPVVRMLRGERAEKTLSDRACERILKETEPVHEKAVRDPYDVYQDVKAELAFEMRKCFEGGQAYVPTFLHREAGRIVERLSEVSGTVAQCLDDAETRDALMAVLRHSECEMVGALREVIVARYVTKNAGGVFMARGN